VALKRVTQPMKMMVTEERAPAGPAFQPKRPASPALPSFDPSKLAAAAAKPLPTSAQAAVAPSPAAAAPGSSLELSDSEFNLVESSAPSLPELDAPALDEEAPLLAPPSAEEIALPMGQAPLLLDVTPQTLRIETVAGFTEVIIERNAAIPVEQSRMFSTSQDFQEVVRARVCQGESRRLLENQELGIVELTGLRPSPRGKTQIEVTFLMDADGTLQVRAKDMQTGTLQSIRINLVGAVDDNEIQRMQERQQALVG
jgi:molecular chaperone DnaK